MENHSVSRNRSRDPQASARDGYKREKIRLGYQLKYEPPIESHPDICSEMVNDVNTFPPKSSELLRKHQDNGKDRRNEELVRYMSNLPSFLKKDVKLNEKALSVGVLDFKLLEKWQNFNKIGHQNSSATSYIPSSTGGSSSHSSGAHTFSPPRQKLPYPTLQSQFYGSHDTESSEVSKLKAQDRKAVPGHLLGMQQQTTLSTHLSSDQKVEYMLKDCLENDPNTAKSSMVRKSQSLEDLREKMKIQDSESLRRHQKMRTLIGRYPVDEVYVRKQETPIGDKYPQARRSLKLNESKILGSNKDNFCFPIADNSEASCAKLSCDMPHSRPPPPLADTSHPHIEEPCTDTSRDKKITNDLFQHFSDCSEVSVNISRGKKQQVEKSIAAVKDQVLINPPMVSNTNGSSGTTKVRNPSPTRRFSFSLSGVSKVSGTSTTAAAVKSSARITIGSSGAEEATISSSSLNNSKSKSKGWSSPLRRLLDPLMRPARASVSDSRLREPANKSSEGHGESTSHTVKVKQDLKTRKNADAEAPHSNNKSSTVQALLQVALRNGVPLFTFAVDDKNDILAATMRKSSSEKEEFSNIYSFFVVQEMKKKSTSWMNQGRKDNTFVPNIVAQMKVTNCSKQSSQDQSITKEYVLFSYDTKQAETSGLEQKDELAAVVVQIRRKSSRHWCQNWQGYENSGDSPASELKQTPPLSSFKCISSSGNLGTNQTEDQLSMTVLLPGGHHGQPIKGEPSSLVKRWKSGGSCDCGGWDVGCQMSVLSDNAPLRQRSSSAKIHHTPKLLELFSQDEGQDQKHVFSLAPFKDGIYAVEFNSSIEILQAFSISLSILSCLKPVEFVEASNTLRDKSSGDIIALETGGKKGYYKPQIEVPAFVTNPPLSPVGRV